MIEETATVVDVTAETVTVQTQRRSACGSCAAKNGCGTAVLAKTVGKKHAIITIEKQAAVAPELSPGDSVVIGINEDMLLNGTMLTYLLPLVVMLLMAAIGQWLGQLYALEGELHIILAAILGLIISISFTRFFFRRGAQRAAYAPVLVRKLQQVTPVRDNILLP